MKRLLLLLLLNLPLVGCIVEHHNFIAINDYLNPHDFNKYTIIVLDIDNTITQPKDRLGSEEWVVHMMNTFTEPHPDSRFRFNLIAPLYFDVIRAIDFIPVELTTCDIIRQLQQMGVIVVGLTARSCHIANRTTEQLQKIGIEFSHAPLWHEDFCSDGHLEYCYLNGIIFCNGNDKGKVLVDIFERLNHCPCKIIAIDDKEKHLHAIARAIDPCIEFIGIRYAYLDEKVRNFDKIAADEELLEWIVWNWLFGETQSAIKAISLDNQG